MCRKGNVEQAIRMPLSPLGDPARLGGEIIASVVASGRRKLSVPTRGRAKIDRFMPIYSSALIRPQSRGFERSALALRDALH